jgi:hypothetical protein
MPILIAIPVVVVLWLFAAWIANDAACSAISTLGQPLVVKAIEKALLACFI